MLGCSDCCHGDCVQETVSDEEVDSGFRNLFTKLAGDVSPTVITPTPQTLKGGQRCLLPADWLPSVPGHGDLRLRAEDHHEQDRCQT